MSKQDGSRVANPTYAVLPKQKYYGSFDEFYPFYLGEHNNAVCRRLHLVGTTISTLTLARVLTSLIAPVASFLALHPPSHAPSTVSLFKRFALYAQDHIYLPPRTAGLYVLGGIVQGYALAWIGHFFYEGNKPATFTHPGYSFMGDLKMASEVWTGQRKP